ncbi:hypothetical protein V1478_015954 [Vespula squamosa]|uniref:Uncharacterized protein n=1 Tax=Vespula squamosa TaxID=30214 RepID=A0ABD2A2C2_VESSQ
MVAVGARDADLPHARLSLLCPLVEQRGASRGTSEQENGVSTESARSQHRVSTQPARSQDGASTELLAGIPFFLNQSEHTNVGMQMPPSFRFERSCERDEKSRDIIEREGVRVTDLVLVREDNAERGVSSSATISSRLSKKLLGKLLARASSNRGTKVNFSRV